VSYHLGQIGPSLFVQQLTPCLAAYRRLNELLQKYEAIPDESGSYKGVAQMVREEANQARALGAAACEAKINSLYQLHAPTMLNAIQMFAKSTVPQTTQGGGTIDSATGGSGTGIAILLHKQAVEAMLNRPMTMHEFLKLQQQQKSQATDWSAKCQWNGMNLCLLGGVAIGVFILMRAFGRRD
jgi:hypothetical protein